VLTCVHSIMMAGTSPAPFASGQSPSFHSSSYLPKMEANFMKDFTCCGLTLASLHDLLQHFEETHANAPAPRPSQPPQSGFPPTSNGQTTSIAPSQTQGEPAMNTQLGFQPRSSSVSGNRQRLNSVSRSNLSTVQDMDTLDDMEMDDINFDNLAPIEEAPTQHFPVQHNQFNQGQNQLPQLNVNLANSMQNHQRQRRPPLRRLSSSTCKITPQSRLSTLLRLARCPCRITTLRRPSHHIPVHQPNLIWTLQASTQ
jgi:transcription factor SFP1